MKFSAIIATMLTVAPTCFAKKPGQLRASTDKEEGGTSRQLWWGGGDPYYETVTPITGTSYTVPAEDTEHEGTWLQWPHDYGWDWRHVARYESIWVEFVKALQGGEKVHIIAYDPSEEQRIRNVLALDPDVDFNQIDFFHAATDDVWVRDNGPIFAFSDQSTAMEILDTRFNGWGFEADWWFDDYVPREVADALGMPHKDVPMVLEGGAIELDGRGTLMAKESSIINDNRNPGWSKDQIEQYLSHYFGVTNFIWLEGEVGYDIVDDHIDGTARFANGNTIVTFYREDFFVPEEYDVLKAAVDANGKKYNIVELPLTTRRIGAIRDWGSYVNYYVGNDVVIMPKYNDPSDAVAAGILKGLYPSKDIVQLEMYELIKDGGVVHCVTQQQPI